MNYMTQFVQEQSMSVVVKAHPLIFPGIIYFYWVCLFGFITNTIAEELRKVCYTKDVECYERNRSTSEWFSKTNQPSLTITTTQNNGGQLHDILLSDYSVVHKRSYFSVVEKRMQVGGWENSSVSTTKRSTNDTHLSSYLSLIQMLVRFTNLCVDAGRTEIQPRTSLFNVSSTPGQLAKTCSPTWTVAPHANRTTLYCLVELSINSVSSKDSNATPSQLDSEIPLEYGGSSNFGGCGEGCGLSALMVCL